MNWKDPYGLSAWGHAGDAAGFAFDASGSGGYYGGAIGGAIGAVAGSALGPWGAVGVGLAGGAIGGAIGGLFDSPGAGQLNYNEPAYVPIKPPIFQRDTTGWPYNLPKRQCK